jgi:hypothetical protein
MTANNTRRATILLCSVAAAVLATSALARPAHHRHRVAQATAVASQMMTGADRDMRYSANVERTAVQSAGEYGSDAPSAAPTRVRNRTRTQPMVAPPATRWSRRRANTSAPIQPDEPVCGVALSWTWSSSARVTGAAEILPAPIHATARTVGTPGRSHRRDGTPWRRACWRRQRHRRKWQSDHCLRQP